MTERISADRPSWSAERWRVVEEIGARNADKDSEEVERDVAEAVAELRADDRAREAVTPRL